MSAGEQTRHRLSPFTPWMEALDTDQFWGVFSPRLTQISEEVSNFSSENCTPELIAQTRVRFNELQRLATDAARFLPPYDIKRSQTGLEALRREINSAEGRLMPRKRFAFRGTKGSSSAEGGDVSSAHQRTFSSDRDASTSTERSPAVVPGAVVVEDLEGVTRSLTRLDFPNDPTIPQVLIRSCRHCSLSISCKLGSVRLQDLSDCVVLLGPCASSVFIEELVRSTVLASAHQMRIHKSFDCALFIRVKSSPIIEECSGIGFAPGRASYDGHEADLKVTR